MKFYSLEKIMEGPEGLRTTLSLGVFDRTALKNFMVGSKEFDKRHATLKMLMYEDKQFDVEEGVIDEAIVSLLGKFVYRTKYKITPIIVKKCG